MKSSDAHWSALAAFDESGARPAIRIDAAVQLGPSGSMVFRFVLHGDVSRIRLPPEESAGRADDLWKHTCFEAFVKEAGAAAYFELNFAPSRQWAVYRFDDYRKGMSSPRLEAPPEIAVRCTKARLEVDAAVNVRGLIVRPAMRSLEIGLSAVVEDEDNRLSYWALKHAADKPDFHSTAAFALHLSV